jgi:hypothetical protein
LVCRVALRRAMVAGGKTVDVSKVRITEAGREALCADGE